MARRRIEGTRHVKRKLKIGTRIGIGALAIALISASTVFVASKLGKLDSDKYSIETVVSRIENRFAAAADVGAVISINTSTSTKPDGTPLGHVRGGGTLINSSTTGNKLTLTAQKSGDSMFIGWKVNGVIVGGATKETLNVVIDTANHSKQEYVAGTNTLYVTNTSDIEAEYRIPLKSPSNGAEIGLIITPNTGHAWIDNIKDIGDVWNGYIYIPGRFAGSSARLILQYVDGDAARAYVYDHDMKQISTGTGHKSDTKDLYVDFVIPDVSERTTIYCIPRLNQTDNSCFVVLESNPADAGTCGGTVTSSNSPFSTQLQATPNKGFKLKDWTIIYDGNKKTVTDERPTVYIDGIYKAIANFEEAYYDVTLEKTEPSDGGSVTGLDSYKEGSNPSISITCNDGYDLDNWSYTTTDGIVHSGTTKNFTIPNIKENISLYVTFKSNKKRIDVRPSPAAGGTVTIKNDNTGSAEKSDYEEFVTGQSAIIKATPSSGYQFLYWKASSNTSSKITDNPYTFTASGDDTYTAYFVPNALNIKTAINNSDAGTVKIKYINTSGTSVESETLGDHNDVQSNTSIELIATANSDYHFVEFVDNNGNHYTQADLTVTAPDVLEDNTYTAVFTGNTFSITLQSDPVLADVIFKIDGNNTSKAENLAFDGSAKHSIDIDTTTNKTGYIFLYWEDQRGNKYGSEGSPSVSTIPSNAGDLTFTARLVPDNVKVSIDVGTGTTTGTVELLPNPPGNGPQKTRKEYSVQGNSTITLKLDGGTDQKPVEVIDENGKSYQVDGSNEVIVPNVITNKSFIAYFEDKEYTVEAIPDPDMGGSVKVNGKYGSDKVKQGDPATLEATPVRGYIFDGWYDNQSCTGTPLDTKATTKIVSVPRDMKLYGHFKQEKVNVTIGVSDTSTGTGSVRLVGYNEFIKTTPKTYTVEGSSTITVEAYPENGAKFEKWVDTSNSKEYTSNPLTIVDVQKTMNLQAVFQKQQCKIEAKVEPLNSGTVKIVSGASSDSSSLMVDNGSNVAISATPAEGYNFLYWTDSTGAQYDGRRGMDGGSTLSIQSVQKSDTYTAHFVKKDLTILLEATPFGAGMVRLGDNPYEDDKVQYHVTGNSSIQIFAEPKDPSKYEFERWENKNNASEVYKTNPVTIVSVADTMHYVAVFVPKELGIKTVASPASGGKVTKTINDDGSVTISAIPNRGYTFANWKKGDKLLTMGVKYTIKAEDVKDGDVYTAYFKINKDYDARTDITKENFYREWRKVYDPSYTVTRETMKQQAHATIVGLRQYDDATPPLKNFAAFGQARAYYESLLEESDIKRLKGIFGDSELITVEGEILNPDLLPDFEVYENKAEDFTLKKFGDKYDTEILTVKRIYEPEQFNNIKRTYLWRYTGAQFKDNIYLLYDINGDKEQWVSPIVDPDGVLKFTIEKLPDEDVVAVVRVKIRK